MAGAYDVRLARGARAALDALHRQHRGRMKMLLASVAATEPAAGLLTIRSWVHVAACEVLAERRVVLVYAILDRRVLRAELFGPDLTAELADRRMARWMHGRR